MQGGRSKVISIKDKLSVSTLSFAEREDLITVVASMSPTLSLHY